MLDSKCLCQYTIGDKSPTRIEADSYRSNIKYFEYELSIGRLLYVLYDVPYVAASMRTFKVVPVSQLDWRL